MCLPVKPYKVEREWKHAGLSCAVTQPYEDGSRCAYVRVPPSHPLFGKFYDEVEVECHGGLTFSKIEPCTEHEDGQGWWFGFDFAHACDATVDPNADSRKLNSEILAIARIVSHVSSIFGRGEGEHYWTQAEVERECELLADQLAAAA